MDLSNVDLLSLQTKFMQQDKTTQALCSALTPQFQQVAEEVKACLIYSRLDELNDKILDELAWQMHCDYYDSTASIDVKRKLIKNSIIIHQTKGTPYAVELLIQTMFGDGYVQEWFEYGGEPYMFKVITSNASVTTELANKFIEVLNSVKNARSHLEEIVISLNGTMYTYFAGIVHSGDIETIRQVS